jgi:hypothetical protein
MVGMGLVAGGVAELLLLLLTLLLMGAAAGPVFLLGSKKASGPA